MSYTILVHGVYCMYTIGHNTCEGLNLYMYKGYMDNASASPFLIDCVHGWAFSLCVFNLMEKLSHVCMLVQGTVKPDLVVTL